MKIAFVVHDYNRKGGHSRYVAELAGRYARQHEVHVYANHIEDDEGSGIHFHTVPAWRISSLTTVLTFAVPASWMLRGDFDIVHSQGFCCLGANVFTSHICSRAWHDACLRMHGVIPMRHILFNAVAGCLEYGLYHFSKNARVIAVSRLVADDLRKHYSCTLPADVIHHGVDLETFSPDQRGRYRQAVRARLDLPPDEPVSLFVGDLRKGARQSILALSATSNTRLLFVTRSDPADYRNFADSIGVSARVHFVGPTNRIQEYYAAADSFLLPSPYDTFGMVALEAMASGLPVIVSREAGASELLEHGVNGLVLSDSMNTEELGSLLSRIESDSQLAARLGWNARRKAEQHSWDVVAERTMNVYESLLSRRTVSAMAGRNA